MLLGETRYHVSGSGGGGDRPDPARPLCQRTLRHGVHGRHPGRRVPRGADIYWASRSNAIRSAGSDPNVLCSVVWLSWNRGSRGELCWPVRKTTGREAGVTENDPGRGGGCYGRWRAGRPVLRKMAGCVLFQSANSPFRRGFRRQLFQQVVLLRDIAAEVERVLRPALVRSPHILQIAVADGAVV